MHRCLPDVWEKFKAKAAKEGHPSANSALNKCIDWFLFGNRRLPHTPTDEVEEPK